MIVVSSNALPKDIQAGLDAGATAYLAKPISYAELIFIVNQIIEKEGTEN